MMKRFLWATLVVVTLATQFSGCGGTAALSMKPIDADIPELRFWYMKGGAWQNAFGQAGDFFSVGDPKEFQIKLNKNAGDCQLTYDDGDTHFTQDCDGQSTVTLNLGNYSAQQPDVIGISVATQNGGIQTGYFYPNMRVQHSALPVTYTCPGQSSSGLMSTCTRPATYDFDFSANITDGDPGQLQFVRQCNKGSLETDVINISGAGPVPLSLNSTTPDFCVIQLNLRQKQLPNGTWAIEEQQNIFVRFYDPTYIPLPLPELTQQSNGSWQACAPDDYSMYSINGTDYGSGWFSSNCKTITGSNLEIDVWDSIGRFSWNVIPPRVLMNAKSSGQRGVELNGFYFYNKARPWVEQQILSVCKPTDEGCIKKKRDELLRNPKMVKAVTAWDASLLYK